MHINAYCLEGDGGDGDGKIKRRALLRKALSLSLSGIMAYFELESSGLREEIRYRYCHKGKQRSETFPYRLADGQWHKIALSISASQLLLHVDCNSVKIAGDHQLFVFFNLEQITVIKHRMAGVPIKVASLNSAKYEWSGFAVVLEFVLLLASSPSKRSDLCDISLEDSQVCALNCCLLRALCGMR
ncbi:protein kinase C-binding protein NELL1 isoform X1 [Tachysurus ichikawai]